MPKSTVDHVSGRQVRLRKQATIGCEVVQPRRSNHLEWLPQSSFDVVEEGAEVCQSLTRAFGP